MAELVREETVYAADPARASLQWSIFVDKTAQSALLLVVTKLAAAWVCAGLWAVPIRSRWIWGFIPYAGLQTTAAQFRHLVAWSTAATAFVAVLWSLGHFIRSNISSGRLWGSFAALPMAALLALLEWWRRFDGDHLLTATWLVVITIGAAVPAVLILGFVERYEPLAPLPPDARTTNSLNPPTQGETR